MIVIELYQGRARVNGGRQQRWRWRATHTGNNKKLAQSSEAYTNKQDCINAINSLFGPGADIRLGGAVSVAEATK